MTHWLTNIKQETLLHLLYKQLKLCRSVRILHIQQHCVDSVVKVQRRKLSFRNFGIKSLLSLKSMTFHAVFHVGICYMKSWRSLSRCAASELLDFNVLLRSRHIGYVIVGMCQMKSQRSHCQCASSELLDYNILLRSRHRGYFVSTLT